MRSDGRDARSRRWILTRRRWQSAGARKGTTKTGRKPSTGSDLFLTCRGSVLQLSRLTNRPLPASRCLVRTPLPHGLLACEPPSRAFGATSNAYAHSDARTGAKQPRFDSYGAQRPEGRGALPAWCTSPPLAPAQVHRNRAPPTTPEAAQVEHSACHAGALENDTEGVTRLSLVVLAAILADPGMYEAYNNLGGHLLVLGRAAEALPLLEVGVKLDQSEAQLWFNLGSAHRKLGNFSTAPSLMRRALVMSPHNKVNRALPSTTIRSRVLQALIAAPPRVVCCRTFSGSLRGRTCMRPRRPGQRLARLRKRGLASQRCCCLPSRR